MVAITTVVVGVTLVWAGSGVAGGISAAVRAGDSLDLLQGVLSVPNYNEELYGSSGSLQGGFSAPRLISEPGDGVESANAAVNGAGDLLVAWDARRNYPRPELDSVRVLPRHLVSELPRGIWYAWRPARGSYSAPRELVAPAPGQGRALATMDAAGEAVVAYEERGSVYLRRARADGSFGPATTVAPGDLYYAGLDQAGELLVVSGHAGWLQARLAAPMGELGKPQNIGRLANTETDEIPQVVMNTLGAAVIADGETVAYRKAGRRFGAPQPLAPAATPTSHGTVLGVASVVMDQQGYAYFALARTFGEGLAPPSVGEASEWDGRASPPIPTPLGSGFLRGMSLAKNEAGEVALAYGEGGTGSYVRFSANGQPFGAPQPLGIGGSCLNTELPELAERAIPQCEGNLTLVGAEGNAFFGISSFADAAIGTAFRVRSLSQSGTGPPVYGSPPEYVSPLPRLTPASFADFGPSVIVNAREQLPGEVACGTEEGNCTIRIVVTSAKTPTQMLGTATLHINRWEQRAVAISLNHLGQRRLAHRGSLTARLVTNTTGSYGPSLETTYPLTILRRHRRHR